MDFLLLAASLLYLAGAFYAVAALVSQQSAATPGAGKALLGLVGAGFALHTATLVIGGVRLGHFPVVNVKEFYSFIAWAVAGYYLLISRKYRARALPTFLLPCAFLLTLISLVWPGPSAAVSDNLAGAISVSRATQVIFPVHVTMLVISYAAFFVTVVAGVMYLIQEHALKKKQFGSAFHRLPALGTCDEICYRAMSLGFVTLTLGMATGIAWSSLRDGRYWHNDPKEVMALITWIIYLILMHYRLTSGWHGRRSAWLAIAGFVVVLITWVGTRAMGGYHVFG